MRSHAPNTQAGAARQVNVVIRYVAAKSDRYMCIGLATLFALIVVISVVLAVATLLAYPPVVAVAFVAPMGGSMFASTLLIGSLQSRVEISSDTLRVHDLWRNDKVPLRDIRRVQVVRVQSGEGGSYDVLAVTTALRTIRIGYGFSDDYSFRIQDALSELAHLEHHDTANGDQA